ncbi:MAG: hypothetical protein V7K18_22610 [Nostoc sp.]|uniref:hypothetical protein n=1 Tax=Nostoc sp. TaxID=1180 RepID=UPI002FF44374
MKRPQSDRHRDFQLKKQPITGSLICRRHVVACRRLPPSLPEADTNAQRLVEKNL